MENEKSVSIDTTRYVVISETGLYALYMSSNEGQAWAEAEKLCSTNPNKKYLVLKILGYKFGQDISRVNTITRYYND